MNEVKLSVTTFELYQSVHDGVSAYEYIANKLVSLGAPVEAVYQNKILMTSGRVSVLENGDELDITWKEI